MIRFALISLVIILSFASLWAQGTTVGSATVISPNGTATAVMNDTYHYWKVSTSGPGCLRFVMTPTILEAGITIYDTDGSTVLKAGTKFSTYSEAYAFVNAGTYYVLVRRTGVSGS